MLRFATRELYDAAVRDVLGNFCLETEWGRSFSAGAFGEGFSGLLFNRDNAYAGLLGLNRRFPELMLESMKTLRRARKALGFTCFSMYGSRLRGVPGVTVEELTPQEFFRKHRKASAINKTDDVCWLWCAYELVESDEDVKWLYANGKYCFEVLYEPFYDASDGMYFGQPTFIDVGHNGYPDGWNTPTEENRNRCVWLKAASTNCLYFKALTIMAELAERFGEDSSPWRSRAERLREAILTKMVTADGSICYFLHRDGSREPRCDALGTAFAVLCGVSDDPRLFEGYPILSDGIPLLHPFYDRDDGYHNNASWYFATAFFLRAKRLATGEDNHELERELLAKAFDGAHFREYCDFRSGEASGSWAQLWTAAAYLGACE